MKNLLSFYVLMGWEYLDAFLEGKAFKGTPLSPNVVQSDYSKYSGEWLEFHQLIPKSIEIKEKVKEQLDQDAMVKRQEKEKFSKEVNEKLVLFFKATGSGYLDRFLHSKPEPSGQMLLTPLYVREQFKQFSGIELEVIDLLARSSAPGLMEKVKAIEREDEETKIGQLSKQAEQAEQPQEEAAEITEPGIELIHDEISEPAIIPEPVEEVPVEVKIEVEAVTEPEVEKPIPVKESITTKVVNAVKKAVSKPKPKPKNKKKK